MEHGQINQRHLASCWYDCLSLRTLRLSFETIVLWKGKIKQRLAVWLQMLTLVFGRTISLICHSHPRSRIGKSGTCSWVTVLNKMWKNSKEEYVCYHLFFVSKAVLNISICLLKMWLFYWAKVFPWNEGTEEPSGRLSMGSHSRTRLNRLSSSSSSSSIHH